MNSTTPNKISVLIVDDHQMVIEGLRSMLDAPDVCVIGEAQSGAAAIEQIRALSPDVVLMDISMPEMDGLEVYRELRKLRPEVKILLSSGYHEQQAARLFAEDPPSDFLKKPYQPSDLLTRVRQLLAIS